MDREMKVEGESGSLEDEYIQNKLFIENSRNKFLEKNTKPRAKVTAQKVRTLAVLSEGQSFASQDQL